MKSNAVNAILVEHPHSGGDPWPRAARGRRPSPRASIAIAVALTATVLSSPPAAAQRPLAPAPAARQSLAAKLTAAEYVDPQGDRWEWRLTDLSGCDLSIRQTIHAPDGALVTDYAIDLADLATVHFANGWVSIWSRGPTIRARTYLRVGEPSEERGTSFEVRLGERRTAQAVARDIANLRLLCGMKTR